MSAHTEDKLPWLSNVLDLASSLSTRDAAVDGQRDRDQTPGLGSPPRRAALKITERADNVERKDVRTPQSRLGNFDKIWEYLGTPLESPRHAEPAVPDQPLMFDPLSAKSDYTSDGATYSRSIKSRKAVTWEDRGSAEEPTADTATDRSASPETPSSTKTQQRRKQRREARKAREAAKALQNATLSESEAYSRIRKTPAKKASAHVILAKDSAKPYNLRGRNNVTKDIDRASIELARSKVAEKLAEIKSTSLHTQTKDESPPKTRPHTQGNNESPSKTRPHQLILGTRQSLHPASLPRQQRAAPTSSAAPKQPKQQSRVIGPPNAQNSFFISPVQPPTQSAANFINAQQLLPRTHGRPPAVKPKHTIEPKIIRSGEDRHWALLMKLIGDFFEDRKYLIAPMNLTTHNNDPKGIHVFVDASNIFIGFTDQLKRSRGIPETARVPPVNLSFDALALLMERRQPVAKRVLVGSTPHQPAFDRAKLVGYECSILEKVYKARELTERQIFFKEHDQSGRSRGGAKAPPANNVITAGGSASGKGSVNGKGGGGSRLETTATPEYAPARMIEQGVDEILHLKILESVVDTDRPSTIVLATGDAAHAEYSSGFMAMAERALKKGWKVELVSWSKNISTMYSRRKWVQTWGDKFKIILLDDYAEELLEM